jgi:hypothetical protein
MNTIFKTGCALMLLAVLLTMMGACKKDTSESNGALEKTLALDQTEAFIELGQTIKIVPSFDEGKVSVPNGKYSWTSDDPSVASVYMNKDFTVTVTGRKLGTTKVRLTSKDGGNLEGTCDITVEIPPYLPAAWSIVSYSSDHSEGRVANLIDDNLTTYWHTNYSPVVPPPHYAVIDLKRTLPFSKIAIAHRMYQSGTSRPIRNIYIDYSNDNINWIPAPLPNSSADGKYIITQNIQGLQVFDLVTQVAARYVRVRVPKTTDMFNADNLACLAEFRIVK